MKHFIAFAATLAVSFAVTPTARADESKFYTTGSVGIGFLSSETLSYSDGTTTASTDADFDPSVTAGGTFGYYLSDNWRLESEIMYRRNDMQDLALAGVGTSTGGDFASLSLALSALYEFRPTDNPRLRAFVGAGLAFVQEIDIDFEVGTGETSFETDELGLQLQAGTRYDFNDRLFLDVTARYLNVSGASMEFPADSTRKVESDYSPLTLSVGLGWRF